MTIAAKSFISRNSIIYNLNRILPLQQLNQIIIDCRTFDFCTILEIVQFTPNCYKLTVNTNEIDEEEQDFELIRNNEIFQYISNTNKVIDLIIKSTCNFFYQKQIKILVI